MKAPNIIYDRNGVEIRDGDRVFSYNLMDDGETMDHIRVHGKIGVPCVFRIVNGSMYVYLNDGSFTGCNPSHPKYGVERC